MNVQFACHCPCRLLVWNGITFICMWWFTSSVADDDVYYLSQNVGAVPMEGVDFPIKSVDVGSSLHRTGSWTVLLCALPLATLTHTVNTHIWTLIDSQWIADLIICNYLQDSFIYKLGWAHSWIYSIFILDTDWQNRNWSLILTDFSSKQTHFP